MIRIAIISAATLALVSGCSSPDKNVLFDGKMFRGALKVDDNDKRSFVATVSPVSQSLDGAREAARYQGTAYCIRKYGYSDIDWTAGPEADEAALNVVEDALTVQGRCSG